MFNCKANFTNYYLLLTNKENNCQVPLLYDTQNDDYIGKIIDLKIVKEFNMLREIENGLAGIKTIGFDTLTGKIIQDDKLPKTVANKKNGFYGFIPVSKEMKNTTLEIDLLQDEYKINAKKYQKYNDVLMNQIALEIIATGDYNRKLGNTIQIGINKYANDKIVKNLDQKFTGTYLISDIEHLWANQIYQHKLKTIKSGYSLPDKELDIVKIR
jgi:hypothetical protein